MRMNPKISLYYTTVVTIIILGFLSCVKEDVNPPIEPFPEDTTGVQFDINLVPYPKLSDYQIFIGDMKDQEPNERVLPYSLITTLFTDYALKKRFLWMPEGVSANYITDSEVFDFPNGTITIKNFYYDNVLPDLSTRIVETRIMFKKNDAWEFAEYVWNEDQTEAYLDFDGSFTDISWVADDNTEKTVNYRIPSESQCLTCHKDQDIPLLIGPKPQNMDKIHTYSDGSMNQLEKWVEKGFLNNDYPTDINTMVDWEDTSQDISDRMRSYVDVNCAHCHRENSHCSYRSMRFAYSESDLDENMGICVVPDENINPTLTHIIAKGNIERSMVYYRMNTNIESERMPLIGRSMIHEEALIMMEEYINSFDSPCN